MASAWNVSEKAAALHRDMLIWDGHAGMAYERGHDARDLERWHRSGVDFVSVNVAFDVPPWSGLAIEAISSYRRQIRAYGDRFALVGTAQDVLRARAEEKLAIAFDLEGTDALNGDVGMVEVFYELGVRQMLFAYNRNNLAGGGCHDGNVGLTDFGRSVVREMNRVGMIVDCTHCSFRTTMEAMELSSTPVIFSHSNARTLHDHERNILDEQIIACASGGGIVAVTGIGLFIGDNGAVVDDLVRHIDHMVELVGPDHVGIGMDSVLEVDENARFVPNDRSYWPARQYPETGTDCLQPEAFPGITQALLDRGYKDEDLRVIFGGNFLRLAETVWKP